MSWCASVKGLYQGQATRSSAVPLFPRARLAVARLLCTHPLQFLQAPRQDEAALPDQRQVHVNGHREDEREHITPSQPHRLMQVLPGHPLADARSRLRRTQRHQIMETNNVTVETLQETFMET